MSQSSHFTTTIIAVLALILLLFGTVFAQTPPIQSVAINYLEANPDETGQVTVSAYVSVSAENGQPVYNLTEESFAILEDGKAVEVASVAAATDPMAVIMVIDTSGSMAARGADNRLALDAAKQAAVSFIQTLAPEDQIAVFHFNDDVSLQQNLTTDHNAAINAINTLVWKDFGGTCLYDATFKAIKKSAEVPQGRRTIIVLTDGVDEKSGGKTGETCSIHTLNDVIDEATVSTTKVPIFTIGFGQEVDEQELLRLASRTGGRGSIAPDSTQLEAVFASVSTQLKNQYLVTYQTQVVSGEHAVVVKVNNGSSQGADERRVFVPVTSGSIIPAEESTAPPEPKAFTIAIADASTDDVLEGELEIAVDLSQAKNIARTVIYVDDRLEQELLEPPFDSFILNIADIGSGAHIIRVEVTDETGFTAVDKRDLTIPEPPPAPVEPAPTTVVVTPVSQSSNLLLFAGVGGGVLLVAIIVAAIILFGGRKQTTPSTDQPLAASTEDEVPDLDQFITEDNMFSGLDPDKTMDVVDEFGAYGATKHKRNVPLARLIVIKSLNRVKGDVYPINKTKVTIGRDVGNVRNDIDIPDKPVSRRQAEINFDGRHFTIRDTDSTYGTFVNGQPIGQNPVALPDNAEIGLGTKTQLRFELNMRHADYDDQRTMDVDIEDDPYKTSDVI